MYDPIDLYKENILQLETELKTEIDGSPGWYRIKNQIRTQEMFINDVKRDKKRGIKF